MKTDDFALGMLVRRRGGESSFVRDRNPEFRGRRPGIVVGLPESVSNKHRAALIQWEGSTRVDPVLIHRLEPVPMPEAPASVEPVVDTLPESPSTAAHARPCQP